MKKTFNYNSPFVRIISILFLLYLCFFMFRIAKEKQKVESFSQDKKFELRNNNTIFDGFYCDVYDKLMHDPNKIEYEINEIKRATNVNEKSVIIDIGSGNGHHIGALHNEGLKSVGIDISEDMVKNAEKKYPNCDFKNGDFMSAFVKPKQLYTHILCMYFTIYYIKNKTKFFNKCFDILKNKGYLVLHLVNRENFDPMISVSNPLVIVSPQSVAKKRITKSEVIFEGFSYKSEFKPTDKKKNVALFEEKITDDATKNVRKNIHTLFMEKQHDIIQKALKAGFLLEGKIDLTPVQYENQYLYILYKSN
jgi:SAM-dependent methyltransferase